MERNLSVTIKTEEDGKVTVHFAEHESGNAVTYCFEADTDICADRTFRADVIQTTGNEIWSWINLMADEEEARKRYYVTLKVDARYVAAVEGNSVDDAINKAKCEFVDCDLNSSEVVGSKVVVVKDESDNIVYEA